MVGYDDPRNMDLVHAIEQRLKDHNDDGVKAFKEPLYRPSKDMSNAPVVRSVRLTDTQKRGIEVRNGVADHDSMLRVDIYRCGKEFFAVPLYVADSKAQKLPNKAVSGGKFGWIEMDENYEFLFSLNKNDFITIYFNDSTQIEGYYNGFDVDGAGRIVLFPHDKRNKEAKIRKGILSAAKIEKYHVDMLGNLYAVKREKRQPLRLPKGKKG